MAADALNHIPRSLTTEASGTPNPLAPGATAPALLTLPEVAKRWAVSPRTVRRLIDDGELAHVRVGHSVRVSETDMVEFVARNRHSAQFKTTNESYEISAD